MSMMVAPITIQEIDENGDALEWVAEKPHDLLNIAEELLTEFDQPQTLQKFKLMMATYHRVGSVACVVWLIKELNALGFYKYKAVFQ